MKREPSVRPRPSRRCWPYAAPRRWPAGHIRAGHAKKAAGLAISSRVRARRDAVDRRTEIDSSLLCSEARDDGATLERAARVDTGQGHDRGRGRESAEARVRSETGRSSRYTQPLWRSRTPARYACCDLPTADERSRAVHRASGSAAHHASVRVDRIRRDRRRYIRSGSTNAMSKRSTRRAATMRTPARRSIATSRSMAVATFGPDTSWSITRASAAASRSHRAGRQVWP